MLFGNDENKVARSHEVYKNSFSAICTVAEESFSWFVFSVQDRVSIFGVLASV